jgi:FdhE protein
MGEEGYRRASPHPWLWPEQVDEKTDQPNESN